MSVLLQSNSSMRSGQGSQALVKAIADTFPEGCLFSLSLPHFSPHFSSLSATRCTAMSAGLATTNSAVTPVSTVTSALCYTRVPPANLHELQLGRPHSVLQFIRDCNNCAMER